MGHGRTQSSLMLVDHFLDADHFAGGRVDDVPLSHLVAAEGVFLEGHVDVLAQEVVKTLCLHALQLLVLREVFLVETPVALVVVLFAQLPLVDVDSCPRPDVRQSRLVQHVEIGIFD